MNPIEIVNVSKSFGDTQAVADVSFEVRRGEIFGLLGPNGAGKTTTIRMVLDIFKPDSGKISILGGEMTEEKKNRVGYMPEDRGLYQDIPLERCILYLASLKGVVASEAKIRLDRYLDRFDLSAHRKKKVKELSKGMQQKAQIITTILHDPELLIIDEPFTALDPVNTRLVQELMRELRTRGTTVVMCTHQMHQVEELCDRLVLIDHGRNVLYGNLVEIRRQYATGDVLVTTPDQLTPIPGKVSVHPVNGGVRLCLEGETEPAAVLHMLLENGVRIEKFEVASPSLNEIFIQVVSERDQVAGVLS